MLHTDLDTPEPGPGEVLIHVRANSLNFRDFIVAHGKYPVPAKPCVIPLSDGAGDVVAVGRNVTAIKVGDRVTGAVFPDWISGSLTQEIFQRSLGGPMDGMLAEYVVLPERAVIPFPAHLSYEEAATLPDAAVTAWHALVESGRIRAGQTVLLLGTGGVCLFALQFAKLHSATVIQTSSSEEKLQQARAMGADHLINYNDTPDWDEEVLRITGGRGVDIVVEVGGAQTLEPFHKIGTVWGPCGVDRTDFRLRENRSPAIDDPFHTPAWHSCRFCRHVPCDESRHCGYRVTSSNRARVYFRTCHLCLCL